MIGKLFWEIRDLSTQLRKNQRPPPGLELPAVVVLVWARITVSGGKTPFGKIDPEGSDTATGDPTWLTDGSLAEIYSGLRSGEDEDGANVAIENPRG